MYELMNKHKIANKSWKKLERVLDNLDPNHFCYPRTIAIGDEWMSKRAFTYWCEKLVEWGLAERKRKSRGWYTWTTYKIKDSPSEIWYKLTGIPF